MTAYTKSLTTSVSVIKKFTFPGVYAGTKVFYSNGSSPELWTEENAKIKTIITDTITGRSRKAEIHISNQRNVKEPNYPSYRRIKIRDGKSGIIIFRGRVEVSEPYYDNSYGQVLKVVARDYSAELFERKINSDYTVTPGAVKRSALVKQIVDDYTSNVSPHAIDTSTYVETSGSSSTVSKNYTNSGRTAIDIIEELAKEDPWTDETWSGSGSVILYSAPMTYTEKKTEADGGTGDFVPFTSTSGHIYLGQNNPFLGAIFDLTTNGTYSGVTWQYYNGATWVALTMNTNYSFASDGSVKWVIPTDWGTYTIPFTSTTKYFVRAVCTTITSNAQIHTIACIPGYGYDYYVDDNQKFHYFRRGSSPSGGALASGLIISLTDSAGNYTRKMQYDYSLSEQPKEIVTRVTSKGTSSDGTTVSYTATNTTLETTYGITKEKVDYVWGSNLSSVDLTTYCTSRAKALLTQTSTDIYRGTVKINKYPYFNRSTNTLVRAGDVVRLKISPKSVDADYVILEVRYEEPDGFSIIEVVSDVYGRSLSPMDAVSQLKSMKLGEDSIIPSARIIDLVVDNAKIGSCSIDKLTVGTLDVVGTIGSGEWTTGTGSRVVFDTDGISGVSQYTLLFGWYGALSAVGSLGTTNVWLQRFTCTKSGTLDIVKAQCGGAGHIKLCLYSDSGSLPSSLLASQAEQDIVTGWNNLTFTGYSVVEGTTYWLGFQSQTAGVGYMTVGSGTYSVRYKAHTYADAFDNPISSTSADLTHAPLLGAYEDTEEIQFQLDSLDGSVLASAGKITIDGNGLTIYDSTDDFSYLKFISPSEDRSARFLWIDNDEFNIVTDHDLDINSYGTFVLASSELLCLYGGTNIQIESNMLPVTDTAYPNAGYDIGSSSYAFKSVYARNHVIVDPGFSDAITGVLFCVMDSPPKLGVYTGSQWKYVELSNTL
jgi:hypothetical protein